MMTRARAGCAPGPAPATGRGRSSSRARSRPAARPGVGCAASSSRNEPWSGNPSRHSAAQRSCRRAGRLGRRRHPLHRLVQVLVEREAGVGRDDDVEGAWHGAHRRPPGPSQAAACIGEQLAAERRDDALLAVEHDVEREVDAGRRGDRADVVVHRVAVGDAPGGARVADARGVVQHEHRLQPGEPGRGQLRAAGEPGEEVRLDEAGGDADVGVDPVPVEPHRHLVAVRRRSRRSIAASRASWLITRSRVDRSRPSMWSSSPRCCRGACRSRRARRSSGRASPSSSASSARTIDSRGCGRVTSQTERRPTARAHESAQRGPGDRVAERRGDGAAGVSGGERCLGAITTVRSRGNVDRETRVAVGELHLHADAVWSSALERGSELPPLRAREPFEIVRDHAQADVARAGVEVLAHTICNLSGRSPGIEKRRSRPWLLAGLEAVSA